MSNRDTLGDWMGVAEMTELAKEWQAFVKARTAFEAAVKAKHPGAVFSYKHGTCKIACPVAGKPNGKPGLAALDPATITALLAALGQTKANGKRR